MDFIKFVSILDKKSLYLPTASRFSDKWEGAYPNSDSFSGLSPHNEHSDFRTNVIRKREEFKNHCFVSCWHVSDYESAAMWELYRNGDVSVALQSTYKSFKESINLKAYKATLPLLQFWFSKVNYIDYETETFEGHVAEIDITPFIHKRRSFEHEKEFRIIVQEPFSYDDRFNDSVKKFSLNAKSFDLKVEISTLIHKVYVSPNASESFWVLVKSVLKTYGYEKIEVVRTDLDKNPIY